MSESTRESHRQFSKSNELFLMCCQAAEINPTKRQAAKFRDGRGTAYAAIKKVQAKQV